ncbi:uncharacterized protein RCO7_10840 [Rhynchosporium graminicola]|uniref:Uncharacterized protein n=1 Tax=Rhynchosporium graminicola TaxID=2792576 RepID=A0A1E1LSX7_9HELO|nr:uncharacterized protein RCO7_10840 [Rhynchosporium commune]
MPNWNIIVLDHGDGRTYGWKSLPGIVARRTALWHHDERAFEDVMRDWKGLRGGSACDEWGGGKQGWFVPRYCYVETSKELFEGEEEIKQGSWDEQADGMSLLTLGRRCRKPERGGEKGGDEISYGEWEVSSISMVLGVVDETT